MRKCSIGRKTGRLLCLLLAAALLCGCLPLGITASAAGTPTSLSLAEFGIKAHRDGWKYQYGGTGQTGADGTRYSDCSGLIYAYFSDLGASGCKRTVSQQVAGNCIFDNDISEGVPNIHGLILTMPDYYAPETGVYGHIGIYLGGGEGVDNSDSYYNMRRDPIVGAGRHWNAWHVIDIDTKYPVNGWYALDGKMVHYTNYEFDANKSVDGYWLDDHGYAMMPGDTPYPVDESMLSSQYASASEVKAYLSTRYSGKDTTAALVTGSNTDDPSFNYNAKLVGDGVRLRELPSTQCETIATMPMGTLLFIDGETTGEKIEHKGKTSDLWYSVSIASGKSGYVSGLFVEKVFTGPTDPVITAGNGYVSITANTGADIYYTIDGTQPTDKSTPYVGALYLTGRTFKAIAYKNGQKSEVVTATVLTNSDIFTDFSTSDWYFSAVNDAVAAGIFHGRGKGIFDPTVTITRSEFVTALAGLDGVDLSQYSGETGFPDVSNPGNTMTKAIHWATRMGYVKGYSDGKFHPKDPINREQMCVILAQYAGLSQSGSSAAFADDGSISAWAKDAVYACRGSAVINGVGGNRFDPQGTATRCQACVVMVALSKLPAEPAPEEPEETDAGSEVTFN